MRRHVFWRYCLCTASVFLIPAVLYWVDSTMPAADLLKIGILVAILMLAMRGLASFYPPANLRGRSLGRSAEYAVLQGLVFSAFMVLLTGIRSPALHDSLSSIALQFGVGTAVVAIGTIAVGFYAQKLRRDP